jgi:DNA-binding NtrC family response regulator
MVTPFIFITAYASIPEAVSTIKEGAIDYLTKPVDYVVLKNLIRRILSKIQGGKRIETSEERYLVGSGPAMRTLYARIEAVASSSASVLIRGENGTGKELVARALHQKSPRHNGPFIPVNCAALNINLLESELFGYEQGAFTGAIHQKIGFFEIAAGGTVFLDEISEISPDLQVKLLRVLQERAFSRVGGTDLVHSDFRLIAATNRNLEEYIRMNKFRQDLFYRLNVIPLIVPPLRDRFEDLSELIDHFTDRLCHREGIERPFVSKNFIDVLKNYDWPGNVRELENLIERILVLYRPKNLEPSYLYDEVPYLFSSIPNDSKDRSTIIEALRKSGNNKTVAAKMLNIPRRTLYYKIEQFKIRKDEYINT